MNNENPNIINLIVRIMEKTEQVINKSGVEKKALALELIKKELGEELYQRYYYLICSVIDFIADISKHGLKTTVNELKSDIRKFFCCQI
jgi:ferritin-like protein